VQRLERREQLVANGHRGDEPARRELDELDAEVRRKPVTASFAAIIPSAVR
jgi:hypothetical protein